MRDNQGSAGLRVFGALLLALGAIPIFVANHGAPTSDASNAPVASSDASSGAWTQPGKIEVQLRPNSSDTDLAEIGARLRGHAYWDGSTGQEQGIAEVDLPSGETVEQAEQELTSDSVVEQSDAVHLYRTPETHEDMTPAAASAEPADESDAGRWKPNDPRYPEQWNFRMVKAEQAWGVTRGKGAIVAVIDTGVAYSDTRKGNRARDFGSTQFVPGYDFCAHDDLPNDDNGHGTHVAGTIAESTDNGEGVAGLAFEARIMPLKVLTGEGYGSSADIAEAVRWAADHGANVINMSLGGPLPDRLMRSACEYARKKGVAIVCAAGNSGREGVGYPAAFPDCIAVSSVGPTKELSFYSSWGKQVAIAAPGGDKMKDPNNGGILQNTVLKDENGTLQDDYFAFQGTSMASPHVAAIAALIVAQGVKDPDDIRCVLQKSAQKVSGPRNKYGAGIVDAEGAARLAGNIYGDGVARFWIVVALFGACYGIGRLRKRNHSTLGAPFWSTAALSLGLLFPDWLTGLVGISAQSNLIAHSVLIPGALWMRLGTENRTDKHLLGWLSLGMLLHLGWEFFRGTTPVGPEVGTLQLVPWVAANMLVGAGILFASLTTPRK
jgi:serine protease